MKTQDLLTRIGGMLMMFSAMWNIVMSGIFFISLVWVLVGVVWLVPMFLALVEILLAVALMIVGFNRAAPAAPLLGMFISACNFNIFGFGIELIAFMLMVGGFVVAHNEQQEALA